MEYLIIEAKYKYYSPYRENLDEFDIKDCWEIKDTKPTLKGAIGWRSRNQKFEGQYLIIPTY